MSREIEFVSHITWLSRIDRKTGKPYTCYYILIPAEIARFLNLEPKKRLVRVKIELLD